MNLADMLAYTAAEYLDDRTTLVGGDPDSLWSNSFLVRQFNEAQRLLTRRAWVIIDEGNVTAGRIVLKTGVATYPLHKSVLRIYTATPSDQDWPLYRTTDLTLRTPRPYSDAPYDLNSLTTSSPGRPLAFAPDAAARTIRIFRTPSATENGLLVNLKVARMPINWLTLDKVDAEPEVPEEWHIPICEYAAGKALTQPNVDGQFKTDGRNLLAGFTETVREARQERIRAEMTGATWSFDTSTSTLGQGERA